MPRRQTSPPPTIDPQQPEGPAPIGVPEGYTAIIEYTDDMPIYPTSGGSRGRLVPPTFYEGDEYTFVYGMTPAELAALQSQLTAVGLLDPDTYSPGFVGGGNDPTLQAIQVVMSYANRAGYRSVTDALRAYEEGGYGAVGSQGYQDSQAAARMPAPVSNPDDLKRVFRAAVIDTLGVGWSEDDINAMVADYQVHERSFNQRAAAGEAIEEQVASPETFAVDRAVAADPTAAQGQDFLEVANSLSGMLGRWSGA